MSVLKNKDIDFLSAANAKPRKTAAQKKHRGALVFPLLLLVALGGGWGFLEYQYTSQRAKLESCVVAVSTLGTQENYQMAIQLEAQIAALQAELASSTEIRAAVDSYPTLSKDTFFTLRACEIPTVTPQRYSYDAQTGTLTIDGKANGLQETALFVRRLRGTGLFVSTEYSGYMQEFKAVEHPSEDGTDATATKTYAQVPTGQYIFTFSGILKGKEA